jgi:methylmalonyl-CoA/ethylmalonyl-CoA epimerase
MATPLLRPLHCGISVANMQESIDWYQDMLGFELVSRDQIDMLKCEVAFMEMGDFQLELFCHRETIALPPDRRVPNKDIQTQGIKHVCYAVADVAGLLEDLRAKGADIVFGPMEMEGTLIGFIRDNTGNLIEFMQK